jgi:hypothetical protein
MKNFVQNIFPQKSAMALALSLALLSVAGRAEGKPMFDPSIDRADEEWCYAAKSTTVVGLPFVPEPVQVTYDGAIYTRYAELCFFYGDPLQPVMARNKKFLEGWIPVIVYDWNAGGIDYHLEIFSAELPELGRENLVQYASLTMSNPGKSPAVGTVAAALRGRADAYRYGALRSPVTPATRFSIDDGAVRRAAQWAYSFSEGAETYAVPGEPYSESYTAADFALSDRSATALAVYRRTLKPGESYTAAFKMPRVPLSDASGLAAVDLREYRAKRAEVIDFWQDLFGDVEFEIPEQRVDDSYRASLVHLILATRDQNGRRQGSGLPYDALFLNDYIDMLAAYVTAGLFELAEPNVDWLINKQHESGMFIDVHNRGNTDFITSHGQGLFALAYPVLFTRDLDYARRVYPAIRKGAEMIVSDHQNNNEYGLLRPSIPYDAPMLTGYHTCHNLFALLALRTSVRVARLLGEDADLARWTAAEKSYRDAILKAIDYTYKKEGYIHPALYDWEPGLIQGNPALGRNDFPAQDWENNLLVYPTELLEPDDPRVAKTLATIRARKYREGVMSYRNGMHIHQYATVNQAQQYRAIGDQEHALRDLYHILLHNGSTHEGFENLVDPWSTRTPSTGCPPPHAWAAAKIALLIRHTMVSEYGGDLGMRPDERDLYLFALISPDWMEAGKELVIRNAPTEMGPVSAELEFSRKGAKLKVRSDFHTPPARIVFRIPYTVELVDVKSNAAQTEVRDGKVYFSPDLRSATFRWKRKADADAGNFQNILKGYRSEYNFIVRDGNYDPARAGKPFLLDDEKDHPAEPLSFDLVRRAFLKEYGRRFEEYRAAGRQPFQVAPPALLSAEQRREQFVNKFGAQAAGEWSSELLGIAIGKPVSASASEAKYPPQLAVDGIADNLQSSWQTDPYPAWLMVDLEQPVKIDRIHIFPYWGAERFYQYTIDVSEDGENWKQVVFMGENATPATPQGNVHEFEACTARYVRVNVNYHNLNRGAHIVELRVYPAK